jgi:hypothetical protein
MRREWVVLTVVAFSGLEGTSLAEKSPSRETAPVASAAPPTADDATPAPRTADDTASAPPTADDAQQTSPDGQSDRSASHEEIRPLRRQHDLPSRAGPILLIVGGGVTTLAASMWLMLGIAGSGICEANCKKPDVTGITVTGTLGLIALTGGIVWLVDVNHRRRALDRHVRTATGRRMLLPVYEPTTRTATLTFSQQF